jgi:predicted enzyme related to lactoylglutathione lyase
MTGASTARWAAAATCSSIVRPPKRTRCFGEPKRVEAPAARMRAAVRIDRFCRTTIVPMSESSSEPIAGVRYGHTNLIARDWRLIAGFYERVFGCVPVPPERDYAGADLSRGTGVPDAALQGVHLRLPGHGADGPTLEIYTYASTGHGGTPAVDQPGWGHIAFAVDDVEDARRRVLDEGGRAVGETVTLTTADGRRVTWCYVTDPAGNIVELQSWAPAR